MFAGANFTLAQHGGSNVRDNHGNLIRYTGMDPVSRYRLSEQNLRVDEWSVCRG
jgi:hypothetical protein